MPSPETDLVEASPQSEADHTEPVVTVTIAALDKIAEIRAAEDEPESLSLRIEVTGVSGSEYAYDLSFESLADAATDDVISEQAGLSVVIPADSVEKLRGAVLDLPIKAAQGGLVIRNPNRPDPLAGADLELTGDLAQRVQQLLDEAINPQLATHGGVASLVGVEDTKVFLSMGGGCQGCALSSATMRQGIEVAIREAIPEVTDIVDVTDHTAGASPFYQ